MFENKFFNSRRQPWPLISTLSLLLFSWAGFSAVWGGETIAAVRFKAPMFLENISELRSIKIHSLTSDWQKSSRVGKVYPLGNNEVSIYLYPDVFDHDIDDRRALDRHVVPRVDDHRADSIEV